MPTLAVALGKGGFGKSTTAVNLAAALAARRRAVRVIDADPCNGDLGSREVP